MAIDNLISIYILKPISKLLNHIALRKFDKLIKNSIIDFLK